MITIQQITIKIFEVSCTPPRESACYEYAILDEKGYVITMPQTTYYSEVAATIAAIFAIFAIIIIVKIEGSMATKKINIENYYSCEPIRTIIIDEECLGKLKELNLTFAQQLPEQLTSQLLPDWESFFPPE